MFSHYPTNEQIFFIRDWIHNPQNDVNKMSDTDREKAEKIKKAVKSVEKELFKLQQVLHETSVCDDELTQKLKEELDPFARDGEIFMGAGHFSEYKCMRIHEYLADAFSWLSGGQQSGLMGTERASEEEMLEIQSHITGFLTKLAEKLGVTNISFENSSKDVE